MDDLIFATVDGKEIGKLETISELELTVEESDAERFFDKTPIEIQGKWESGTDIMRFILPQGLYNGYVLKRDGYLSPQNGWISNE